ncbi:MAG TPA: Mur ligase family protein [Actinomycetota bacterium]|nr:Mur ligase family protein [Actinomycetota bacterium]
MAEEAVRLVELRVLEGPNIYFPRPAIKLTLSVAGWLDLSEERAAAVAKRIGLPGSPRPGPPRSGQRLRFTARAATHLARALARAMGTRLALRARPGPEPDQIVVAFPWRRRASAEALGKEVAELAGSVVAGRKSLDRLVDEAAGRLRGVELGDLPDLPAPNIPVVAITGTNGKTTTVRLLAHIGRVAGLTVAYTSTDGVFLNAKLVEEGDYSGFLGARMALSQPGVQLVVLETARGGILLRGIGAPHNDVAVVTNVSADHIGLHGIKTLDQLAEVKAAITRITKPEGWDVLNADDPRVLAMRRGVTGQPFLFTMDSDHPAIRWAITEGGRAMTVMEGSIVVVDRTMSVRPLVPLEEVPATLAGVASQHVQNAMAAAAAALGVGIPEDRVVEGLRTFVPDPERNPGRANVFELDGRVIVVDYAHNEEGMRGLVEICRGLRPPGGEVWVAICAAGDRSREIRRGIGYVAARGADHVVVSELRRYLRGAEPEEIVGDLRAGAIDGGATEVPAFPDEIRSMTWMLKKSSPDDVVSVAALSQRPEIFALLAERGGRRTGPDRVRELARAARAAT